MDSLIQAGTVIAVFAAVHERIIELLQIYFPPKDLPVDDAAAKKEKERRADKYTLFLSVTLALITHADLFALFKLGDGKQALFFDYYLDWSMLTETSPKGWDIFRTLVGCVLMGLATSLGSKFWHDVVKTFTDVRSRLKDVKKPSNPA